MDGFGGTTLRIRPRRREDHEDADRSRASPASGWARAVSSRRSSTTRSRETPTRWDRTTSSSVATGVMTGSFCPVGSKVGFGCISPATNGHADSSMGGHFGPELKYAGYDLIVFENIAPEPSYLYIDDDTVEIRPAGDYWGMGSLELEKRMKDDLGEDFQIATIGPAGENGIVFSCITHDFGRQAGRCGVGAVMGSKKLKAIAVRGTKGLKAHDLPAMTKFTYDIIQRTKTHPNMAPWQKYGTAFFVGWSNERGCFPTRNFQQTYFEDWKGIDGEKLVEECLDHRQGVLRLLDELRQVREGEACPASPTSTSRVRSTRPSRSSAAAARSRASTRSPTRTTCCDNVGMDTMSGGSTVAFAMECYQRGIITKDDLEGHELALGQHRRLRTRHRHDRPSSRHRRRARARHEGRGGANRPGTASTSRRRRRAWSSVGYDTRWYPAQLLSYCTCDIGAHHSKSWAITADIELGRDTVDRQGRRSSSTSSTCARSSTRGAAAGSSGASSTSPPRSTSTRSTT